eukprot:CCRYP_019600-RA/>CCRYP_019600-RA protein AED:0.02 eAED:0.02 QI:71/1/1/1/1/1/3/1303/1133
MTTDQAQGNRTPNGASDLLDDGANDVSTDQAASSSPLEAAPAPTATDGANQDAFAENNEDSTQEQAESAGQETKLSIAAVSAIVDSVVKHKQSHNDDISAIVHREIDRYYDQEQGNDENMALVPHAESSGKSSSFLLDGIHGEGGAVEEGQRAPYQDGGYGEQPPMSFLNGETTKTHPANGHYKPEKKQGVTFHTQDDHDEQEEYDNIVVELGVTPESHPQYFQRKRYKLPIRILHNQYCQVCIIVMGLVILSLSIAALVTKGFETVKKREAQLHPSWQVQSASDGGTNGSKEKMDWWLDNGGNGLSEKEFESLAYSMEDSYLPIWFDRKSGWEGQTYQEAVEFCSNHDEFMPCPYEVYCPGKTGKLIEGTMGDGISWAPIRDEMNGWVQVGAGGKECDVYLESDENQTHPYKVGVVGKANEEMTRHIMCCLQTPLSDDTSNDSSSEVDDTKQDGDVAPFSPNLDLPESPPDDNSHLNAADVDKWYLQQIMKKYNPRWYDRESKWNGTTYQDAVSFCYSANKKVPCPYSVYCPKGPTGNVIFNLAFDEGESWAATGDRINQFVQVGKEDQCNRVTAENPSGYDENNGGIDVMSHLMCCDDVSAGGEVTQTTTDNQSQPNSASGTTQQYTLTELEHAIKNRYIPFWFGFKDGWNGSTYDEAVKFCASVDPGRGENFHLCPLAAYCPNGPEYEKPLFLQKEAFEGEQWSPTSFAENAWIQVGQLSEEDPRTCTTYLENYHQPPDWGLDGSEPGIKQHILCCKGGSPTGLDSESDNVVSTQSDPTTESSTAATSTGYIQTPSLDSSDVSAQGSIQGMPQSIASSAGTQNLHMGSGNSSPHGGTTTHEAAIVVHLRPVWYDHSQGWNGGSHSDAESFCNTQGGENPMTLCPYDAYCPKGPSSLALGGLEMSFATEEQYAPYHGGDDHWVLIGRFNNARTTTCLDYHQLFGETPPWGSDDSNKELKQHLLCCATSETLQGSSVPVSLQSTASSTIEATATPSSEGDHPKTDAAAGIWYGISDGWKGGSHTDAIIFCNSQADDDGVPMELCPYDAYCPNGPSKPTAPGNTYLGINEEREQWSPTLSKGNHWVLVGSRGGNDSTTCLDTWQLDGDDNPSWGLDGSNNDRKHHLMCCPLTR